MKNSIFIFFLALSSSIFAQNKEIIFQKVGSNRTFSLSLDANAVITMAPIRLYLPPAKRYGIICGYIDSTICFKPMNLSKDNNAKVRAIKHDKTLTRKQKQAAFLKVFYPDSINVPYDSIEKIDLSLWNDKKYRFRCISATVEYGVVGVPAYATFITLFLDNPASSPETINEENVTKILIPVSAAVCAGSYYLLFHAGNKIINTTKWKLKN